MIAHLKRMLILGIMLAGANGTLHAMDIAKNSLNEELLEAVKNENTNEVLTLINEGADVNFQDKPLGNTALIFAVGRGHLEIASILIKKGAKIDHSTKGYRITAFGIAVSKNDLEMCKTLVTAMLKLTKEQKDSVYALIASLERTPELQTSKDTRRLIAQALIDEYKKENLAKTRAEIEKIKNGELRNQLLQLLERK